MADNRPMEGTAGANCDPTMPHMSDTAESRQDQTTQNNERSALPHIYVNPRAAFEFGARTAEHSRILADNISSTIRPLIQHATYQVRPAPLQSHSYVINLEEHPPGSTASRNESVREHHVHETANMVAEGQNNNNNTIENGIDNNNDQLSPESRAMVKLMQQYIPFLFILLTKILYDHKTGILMAVVLLITFVFANDNLKREIAKQNNRSRWLLLLILCYITACIVFVAYTLELHTLAPYAQPLTIWDLLCYVIVMDFFLKLITIVCKVLLTCLPVRLLAFQNRGKYYLLMEATSQLYRSVAPIQPWLYYLFETYQGPEKIVGILFSLTYTFSKGNDLLPRLKLFRNAVWKLFQNVNLGVSPSKEQLIASGGICAICHEKYSTPVRLHCKHIFCEMCISTWLDRERSCPLCRSSITDDPIYRDGHTTQFIQMY
ncbi:PREDICTED: RING finger and transmembrane domain-containing protein 2-like isoform X2 [Dinoponera quadriceps]|uniref:RING finger and transmembrane domain-containing protein 2-like isoform X2 n=1 Tax=Dinoponera quadriceps TaxID=609295 RepID=A0A6P3Y4G0_DINQU|nr:PREDICTED: RING finger and transmembrane domain-containing protein 2-like isoform X2 [Dinoponera quadriceps]